jgi:hypothetical protein
VIGDPQATAVRRASEARRVIEARRAVQSNAEKGVRSGVSHCLHCPAGWKPIELIGLMCRCGEAALTFLRCRTRRKTSAMRSGRAAESSEVARRQAPPNRGRNKEASLKVSYGSRRFHAVELDRH